jgi:hypothetical protein
MAWETNITDEIQIITGDNLTYTPLYTITDNSEDFNVTEFNFPNIAGTLVDRREVMGRKFTLELAFQGDDHLDVAERFRKSSHNKNPWKVLHPIYGDIYAQPTSIKYDSSGLSITKISCTLIETILNEAPRTTVDPVLKAKFDVVNANELASEVFGNDSLAGAESNNLLNDLQELNKVSSSSVASGEQSNELFNKYNDTISKVTDSNINPSEVIFSVRELLSFPAYFNQTVQNRIEIFKAQIDTLLDIEDFSIFTDMDKKVFQNNVTTLMNGICLSAITPIGNEYQNANDVVSVIGTISTYWDSIVTALDNFQSSNVIGWNVDYNIVYPSQSFVSFVISSLMGVAMSARQERILLTEKDTNVIVLTHRIYGIDDAQNNIDNLISQNNIGVNEMIQIKKGREIKYYI